MMKHDESTHHKMLMIQLIHSATRQPPPPKKQTSNITLTIPQGWFFEPEFCRHPPQESNNKMQKKIKHLLTKRSDGSLLISLASTIIKPTGSIPTSGCAPSGIVTRRWGASLAAAKPQEASRFGSCSWLFETAWEVICFASKVVVL